MKATKTKEYKVPASKTWRFMRSDVTKERSYEIGHEFTQAGIDRAHNVKEFIKHPFKKEKRELVQTKHHWK